MNIYICVCYATMAHKMLPSVSLVLGFNPSFVLSFFKCPLMLGVCITIYETPTFNCLQTKDNN